MLYTTLGTCEALITLLHFEKPYINVNSRDIILKHRGKGVKINKSAAI